MIKGLTDKEKIVEEVLLSIGFEKSSSKKLGITYSLKQDNKDAVIILFVENEVIISINSTLSDLIPIDDTIPFLKKTFPKKFRKGKIKKILE